MKYDLDLATNSLIKTFPYGMTAEVLSVDCLKVIIQGNKNILDLEHN